MKLWIAAAALLSAVLIPRVAHAELLHTRLQVFGMD
jgi:hypothetical protein